MSLQALLTIKKLPATSKIEMSTLAKVQRVGGAEMEKKGKSGNTAEKMIKVRSLFKEAFENGGKYHCYTPQI